MLDVYPARERAEDHPGVSGLLIAEAAADAAHGRPVYWLPSFDDAAAVLDGLLDDGDVCLVMGAGDVDALGTQAGGRVSARGRAPRRRRRPARRADRAPVDGQDGRRAPSSSRAPAATSSWRELLRWADAAGVAVNVVGSGSNLLIADDGVAGPGAQARPRARADRASTARGSPAAAARACRRSPRAPARAGLSGIEFGVNIPGTVGGAVRMNANAYGGELARVLAWVDVVTAAGAERRSPEQLGFAYRSSNIAPGEVVARASVRAGAIRSARRSRRRSRRCARAATRPSRRASRRSARRSRTPTTPRAQGRSAGLLLAEAGCNGLAVGGARFSPKHANFIENTGGASTADVLAVMAEGRRRVLERFGVELEPEVQTLGDVRLPWA